MPEIVNGLWCPECGKIPEVGGCDEEHLCTGCGAPIIIRRVLVAIRDAIIAETMQAEREITAQFVADKTNHTQMLKSNPELIDWRGTLDLKADGIREGRHRLYERDGTYSLSVKPEAKP